MKVHILIGEFNVKYEYTDTYIVKVFTLKTPALRYKRKLDNLLRTAKLQEELQKLDPKGRLIAKYSECEQTYRIETHEVEPCQSSNAKTER